MTFNFGAKKDAAVPGGGGFGAPAAPPPAFGALGGAAAAPSASLGGGFGPGTSAGASAPAGGFAPPAAGFTLGGAAAPPGAGGFGGFASPPPTSKTKTDDSNNKTPSVPTFGGGFGNTAAGKVSFGDTSAGAGFDGGTKPSFGAAPANAAAAFASPTPAGGFKASGFNAGGGAPAPAAAGDSKAGEFNLSGDSKGAPAFGAAPPASTTGGVSFGAKTAPDNTGPAPGFGDKKEEAKTPQPGGGGVSFGGAKPPSTPGAPPTPATPAPVNTPGQTPAPVNTPAAPVAATAAPVAAPKAASPLDYKNSTVEQVLNLFQKQLETDSLAYLEESRRVAESDAIIRDAQRDISNLTEQTHLGAHQQQKVEQTLQGIGDLETELDRTLQQLETQVDEIFAVAASLAPTDADRHREHAYATARALDTRLASLTDTLQQSLHQMSETQERVFQQDATIGPIVKVLHQHQTAILDLESAGQKLEHDVTHVCRLLSQK